MKKIKRKYSIVSLLILLAFSLYIACNRDRREGPQDGFGGKPATDAPKPKKEQQNELRYLTEFQGKVVGIKDGDTFEVLFDGQPERVRLAEIDCPEGQQPFGNKARQYASQLCFGKMVTVTSTGRRDRYERVVGTITTQEGVNVNEELVRSGLAWHYKRHSQNDTLGLLEDMARKQRLGLWQDKNPVAPWDWRKYKNRQ